MRKGTIHVSMKQDQFFYYDNVQLAFYKCTSEYTCISVLINIQRTHLQNIHHTSTGYIRQTQSPKWSLFSQWVTFNKKSCVHVQDW